MLAYSEALSGVGVFFFFFFPPDFPPPDPGPFPDGAQLYGRISRVDSWGDTTRNRVSIEFDTIEADPSRLPEADLPKAIESSLYGNEHFALLRIVTTLRRFFEFSGVDPEAGKWFRLRIGPDPIPDGLPTWRSPLDEGGYRALHRGYTVSAQPLAGPDDEPIPQSVGAAAVPQLVLPPPLSRACDLATLRMATLSDIGALLKFPNDLAEVVVRDVGQASFIEIKDDIGITRILFDVGLPNAFNKFTAPATLDCDESEAIIILSHWDWDHFHAGHTVPGLRDRPWIAPAQKIGPSAAKFAHKLHQKGKLFLWPGGDLPMSFGNVFHIDGAVGNRNNTGLALDVQLVSGRRFLMVGDADFSSLTQAHGLGFDALIATHHGARLSRGSLPAPPRAIPGTLALSYGKGNHYQHPHPDALATYRRLGWDNERHTAGKGGRRSDIELI